MQKKQSADLAQSHLADQSASTSLFLVIAVYALSFPGAVVGAGLAWILWRGGKGPVQTRVALSGLGVVMVVMRWKQVTPFWFWRFWTGWHVPSGDSMVRSVVVEMFSGPALLLLFDGADWFRRRNLRSLLRQQHADNVQRDQAVQQTGKGPGAAGVGPVQPSEHPKGLIRLGVDSETGKPFDLQVSELAQHLFLPGASGTGKTTTLRRIAEGVARLGWSIAVVDCKADPTLREAFRRLAQRSGLPFVCVDPDDPKSIGYNPCQGDPAEVANKLIGAFTYEGASEVYKHTAMEAVPVIVRGLMAAQQPVTLDAIYDALGKGGMAKLGRMPGVEEYRDRLTALGSAGGVGESGYLGLQKRFGALIEGKFGEIFRRNPALVWRDVMSTPSITYVGLSATASSEDVALFGRVVIQDLKQQAKLRFDNPNLPPVLAVIEELPALKEPVQVTDALVQLRAARIYLAVTAQYFPEMVEIRTPLLQAGLIISHRLAAQNAEALAAEFGTKTSLKATAQVDYISGVSEKGSVRQVEEYRVHPNTLRELTTGVSAVLARQTGRLAIVRVLKPVAD